MHLLIIKNPFFVVVVSDLMRYKLEFKKEQMSEIESKTWIHSDYEVTIIYQKKTFFFFFDLFLLINVTKKQIFRFSGYLKMTTMLHFVFSVK